MSGTYGYFPKVTHPNTILTQTLSDGARPFYFGASQVPIELGLRDTTINSDLRIEKEAIDSTVGKIEGKGLRGLISKRGKTVTPAYCGINL